MVAPQRVFVRAPNWVGDFVMATPAFARIRTAFPAATIVGGMRGYLRGLQEGADWFDATIDTPRAGGLRGLLAQARALRAHRFDLAILLPNSLETALVARLAGIPQRFGYTQGRGLLMTGGPRVASLRPWWSRTGVRRAPEPMPDYYRRLLDALGLPPGPTRTTLPVTDADRSACDAWLAARGVAPDRRLVLFTAGASFGASKLWLPERFAAVARHFAALPDTTSIVLAGPAETALAQDIAAQAGRGVLATTDPVLPFGTLKALVERSALLITTDTGPRHIAVAFGKPVVCVMGPTDPRYTNYALERQTVIRRDLPCVPCHRKVCPLGHHDCMRGIEVAEVISAAERSLAP
ncbi:MAG: lipopolysaccharide heptosyltransferase II [Planctomycetes bacterium]|nr:lipopolysaccharide heptosyltransferase II [Planctomycetota bacterium]